MSQRALNRWGVAYTLIHNPDLRPLTASRLALRRRLVKEGKRRLLQGVEDLHGVSTRDTPLSAGTVGCAGVVAEESELQDKAIEVAGGGEEKVLQDVSAVETLISPPGDTTTDTMPRPETSKSSTADQ